MRVAAVQFRADRQQPEASSRRLVALADEAGTDADLVVLPELAVTGYVFTRSVEAQAVAEDPEGGLFHPLSEVARRRGTWIVGGYIERAGDRLYNAARVIDPDGALRFSYRKTLLYDEDRPWATPGDSGYRVFDTGAGTFTVGICMDLNDPRFLRWCWRNPVSAIAFPTNWIEEGIDVWPYWSARIFGTGAVLVAANTWGVEGHLGFTGRSAIVDERRALAGMDREGDGVVRSRLRA